MLPILLAPVLLLSKQHLGERYMRRLLINGFRVALVRIGQRAVDEAARSCLARSKASHSSLEGENEPDCFTLEQDQALPRPWHLNSTYGCSASSVWSTASTRIVEVSRCQPCLVLASRSTLTRSFSCGSGMTERRTSHHLATGTANFTFAVDHSCSSCRCYRRPRCFYLSEQCGNSTSNPLAHSSVLFAPHHRFQITC